MRTLALLLLITPLLAQEDPPPNIIVTPNQGLRINVDPNPDREPAFDEITAANNPPAPDSNTALPDTFQTEPLDDGVRVSILGYHEFSSDRPNTAMRIQTGKFRRQMEAIRNLGYPVITMDEFMAWKRGQNELPPRCFLITIDDGWKSVYTEAYPILKEMNLPFTLFLYKKYVDGGGRALSSEMINEMLSSGLCTIGSHSVSHPFPSKFRAAKKKGPDTYKAFLQSEFGDSKIFLEQRFGQPVPTYAYPGGYITEDMHPVADEVGYEFLFSVNPGMTRLDSKNHSLPRYIILGNTDSYFEL
ncbi:MAG: polysaccharide deacetylase family protein, partial [Verrucomicrobiota bacterium]